MELDPITLKTVATALVAIAQVVDRLGPGGLLALALAGPVVLLIAILALSYWHGTKQNRALNAYREDTSAIIEEMRLAAAKDREASAHQLRDLMQDTYARDERRRSEMDAILASYGDAVRIQQGHYNDNVELVRSWDRVAKALQDIVVTNTAAIARLCGLVENNQWCPVAREQSKGKR
ncbi:MAG: hypothetical protein AB7E47_05875 [Desulfovibrionaceae bacterium]